MERKSIEIKDNEYEWDYEVVRTKESPYKHDLTLVEVVVEDQDEFFEFSYTRSYREGIMTEFPIPAYQVFPVVTFKRDVVYLSQNCFTTEEDYEKRIEDLKQMKSEIDEEIVRLEREAEFQHILESEER